MKMQVSLSLYIMILARGQYLIVMFELNNFISIFNRILILNHERNQQTN